jgi:hypothetical protein
MVGTGQLTEEMRMSSSISHQGLRGDLRQLLSPPVVVVAIVLFGVYLLFDLREGGREADLTTTEIVGPGRYGVLFGDPFMIGMVVLDVLLALASAILLVQSYRMVRARRKGGAAGACTTGGSLLLGFCTFACPGCPLPVLASLSITFAATSLPLYGLEFKLLALAMAVGVLIWIRRRQSRMTGNAAPAT